MTLHDHDVVVLGGGPAGALTAALLCRQVPGIRVLVLERERFPRHHVGEVTLPGWTPILRRAGAFEALDAALSIKKLGVVFRWGPPEVGESWTADFREESRGAPAAGSWHVDRAELDTLLLQNARDQGAEVLEGARVVSVEDGCVRWTCDGDDGEARARWVVDATGQARLLARTWKLGVHRHEDMSNVALYGYWSGSKLTEAAAIEHPGERWALVNTNALGWLWHIPIAPDVVSIGLVTNRDSLKDMGDPLLAYLDAVRDTAGVGELVHDAEFVGDRPAGGRPTVAVAEDWSYRVERVCGPGFFLVGDAAVFVDPVLSSGLTLAANGASMAANAITTLMLDVVDEDRLLAGYQRSYAALSDGYHRMARVWYGRNLRAEGWHWQARRERLRLGQALHETDAEAFTAVCLGILASPLDAAVGRASRDGWGSEFFNWLVSGHLFAAPNQDFSDVAGGDEARGAGRRSIARRWRRLALGRLGFDKPWTSSDSFHTHRFLDRWRPVRIAEIEDLVIPDVGVLERLDGSRTGLEVVGELVDGGVGESARDARVAGICHTLLQLDMLGLLEVDESPEPPPRWTGSPLMRLVSAVLSGLPEPADVAFEVDMLGESMWIRVQTSGQTRALRFGAFGGDWPHSVDAGLDEVGARVLAKTRDPAIWSDLASRVGLGLRFEHVPGEKPVAKPL